ncbi:MAG: PEP-CTERM sorting domain-containing protein [Chitinophagaceae bacterium]|nr:PEP-CTERM sorting domain-containing protein [Rubrivivax sp.]
MNLKKLVLCAAVALSAAGTAQADQLWSWSYAGTGVTASGTFTTAGLALAPEAVTSITGARNGAPIVGLVALGADPDFIYDNLFQAAPPHFTDGGLVFSFSGGLPNVNLYYLGGDFVDLRIVDGDAVEIPVSFSVTAVPEPSTALAMMAGLGLLGVVLRKSRAA